MKSQNFPLSSKLVIGSLNRSNRPQISSQTQWFPSLLHPQHASTLMISNLHSLNYIIQSITLILNALFGSVSFLAYHRAAGQNILRLLASHLA